MAISPEQLAMLFAPSYQQDVPTAPAWMGMQGAATPLSIFLNPPKRGEHRVGALGPQLGQLKASTLKALFPLAMGRYEQRQQQEARKADDQRFAQWAATLPAEQRVMAERLRYEPKEIGAAREMVGAAERDRAAREWWKEQETFKAGLKPAPKGSLEADRMTTEILGTQRPVEPGLREKAEALGVPISSEAIMLPSKKHKELYEKYALGGMPSNDVLTGEDVQEIEQNYAQYKATREGIVGPPQEPLSPSEIEGLTSPVEGPSPDPRYRYSPDELLKTKQDAEKFDRLVKMHKGDVEKAWKEFKDDAKEAEAKKAQEAKDVYQRSRDIIEDTRKEEGEKRAKKQAADKEISDLEKQHIDAESEWMAAKDAADAADRDPMAKSSEKASLRMKEKEAYNRKLRIEELLKRHDEEKAEDQDVSKEEISQGQFEAEAREKNLSPEEFRAKLSRFIELQAREENGEQLTENEKRELEMLQDLIE